MVSLGDEPESILGQPIYPSVNVLELQRDVAHDVESSHRNPADLRVAVVVGMTVVVEDRAIHPSRGSIMTVEDVVEIASYHHLAQACETLSRTEGVVGVDVGLAVARQGAHVVLRVVEILAAHEAGVPDQLCALIVERGEAVEDCGGREGERRRAVVDLAERALPIY